MKANTKPDRAGEILPIVSAATIPAADTIGKISPC